MLRTILICILLITSHLIYAGGEQEEITKSSGKLTVWIGYPETESVYQKVKPRIEKKYPEVQVEILTFDLGDFKQKLATNLPAGAGPDLIALNDNLFSRYYEGNYFEPLPDDIERVVNNSKLINPVFAKGVTRNGTVYALPYWTGRAALFYNIDHLKEAGLSEPPVSVKDLWSYGEKLVKKEGDMLTRAGITQRITGPAGLTQKFGYLYFEMVGEQLFETGKNPGTVKVTLVPNLDIAAKALMDRINHLHGKRKVDDWKLKHDAQGFSSGLSSLLLRESWVIAYVKKHGPDINFGVTYMPKDKAWGAFNFYQSLIVNRDSKLRDVAWDYARMLQEKDILMTLIEDSGWLPLRSDLDLSAFLDKNPLYKAVIEVPDGYHQYVETPSISYQEVVTRVGELFQEAYRDASLVDNIEGCKNVIIEANDIATTILKDDGTLSE